jgi:hypothetical protein
MGAAMATLPQNRNDGVVLDATTSGRAGEVSRRTLLVGTMATTAMAAVLPVTGSAVAATIDPDMMAFLLLSAALTGVHVVTLAPEFVEDPNDIFKSDTGIDPINIKNEYFDKIKGSDEATFAKLLKIAKDHPKSPGEIIAAVNADDNMKFLARSLVLLWYLGSLYDPKELRNNSAPGAQGFVGSQVVSAKAYTQGLVWQIAQAHPMGYSNLQFGYWSRLPNDPNDATALITRTIP